MSGELTPQQRDLRISDAERQRVMDRLQAAVGEGRLSLDEFQERVDAVLKSKTYAEIEPYVADLPGVPGRPIAPEVAEIRSTASSLKRKGRWVVPRRLIVRTKAGSVKLDFTEAIIEYPLVEIDLNVIAGSATLVLPPGASANADAVEMVAGAMKMHDVSNEPDPGAGPHFLVTGTQWAGGLKIRRQRRFLRWRW